MSTSNYEYKTVALPRAVQARRKRNQNEADLVAEVLGETIYTEAVDGWEYMRSEVLTATGRAGMFSKSEQVTYYNVLIFRRVVSSVWPADGAKTQPAAAPEKPRTEPAMAPLIGDPTSPLAYGRTLNANHKFVSGGQAEATPSRAPRPPLGSAQD